MPRSLGLLLIYASHALVFMYSTFYETHINKGFKSYFKYDFMSPSHSAFRIASREECRVWKLAQSPGYWWGERRRHLRQRARGPLQLQSAPWLGHVLCLTRTITNRVLRLTSCIVTPRERLPRRLKRKRVNSNGKTSHFRESLSAFLLGLSFAVTRPSFFYTHFLFPLFTVDQPPHHGLVLSTLHILYCGCPTFGQKLWVGL